MKKKPAKKRPTSPAHDIVHRELVVVQAALAVLPALIEGYGDKPLLKREIAIEAWELAEAFVDEGTARLDREPVAE